MFNLVVLNAKKIAIKSPLITSLERNKSAFTKIRAKSQKYMRIKGLTVLKS